MDRREFLILAKNATLFALLSPLLSSETPQKAPLLSRDTPQEVPWPANQEAILARVEKTPFSPGSTIQTTFCPRKEQWEIDQLPANLPDKPTLETVAGELAEVGLTGVRLVVFPFELTEDGTSYKWAPMESMIELMHKNNLQVELCLGPLDYPYDPGIRLPTTFTNQLAQDGVKRMTISMKGGSASEIAIRDWSLNFLEKSLTQYANDPRINGFNLGNEYPDEHGVEGVDVKMKVNLDYMQETVRIIQKHTRKPICLNTNIPPEELSNLVDKLGPLLTMLKEQAVLGLDTYPQRGSEVPDLTFLKQVFPLAEIVYTELQGEPWPPSTITGQSWAKIFAEHPELITNYYEGDFPATIDSFIVGSGIKKIGLWGAPVWPIVRALGYAFPLKLLHTMSDAMAKS